MKSIPIWLVATALVLMAALHVLAARGMFADGAYFLFDILRHQGFWNYDPARVIAQVFNQAPLLAAIKIGIENTATLARFHTIGAVYVPIAMYLLAIYRVRHNPVMFGAFVLIIVAIYQNINFSMSGEYVFLYAVATAALALLLQDDEPSVLDCSLIVVLAALSLRTYEAAVYLGPTLALACMLRFRLVSLPLKRGLLVAAAAVFLIGAGLAVISILHPGNPANFAAAASLAMLFVNKQLIVAGFILATFAAYALLPHGSPRFVAGFAFVVSIAVSALPTLWSIPGIHYWTRTIVGGALLAISLGLIAWRFSPLFRMARADILIIAGPVVALFISIIPDMHYTLKWSRFLGGFEAQVNSRTGLVPLASAHIPLVETFGWPWVYPTLSILLRNGPNFAVIVNPDNKGWEPFDPSNGVPDLGPYYWR
jgi:hypothetical protein